MANVKYMTKKYNTEIERIAVLSETEKTITFFCPFFKKPRRAMKSSRYEMYHDTWEDAKDHLLGRLSSKLAALLEGLEETEREFANVDSMQKPDDA